MRSISIYAISILVPFPAFAEQPSMTTQGLFENICVGGQLDEKLLEPFVRQTGTIFKAKIVKVAAT
jgi:hypothetical protein